MIDINFLRENPDVVRENIKKKFQDAKLPLVDNALEFDKTIRECKVKGDTLRANRNTLSGEVGKCMKEKNLAKAEELKAKVKQINEELVQIDDVNVLAVLLEFFNDENEDYGGVCETLMNDIWDNYSAEQIIEAVSQKFDYLVENDLSRFACLTSILLNEEDFEKFRAMFNEIKSKNSDKYLESLYKLCSDNYPSEINLLREDMKKW